MINIFDTLNSEKYREVVEDREVILEKLTLTGLKVSPGRESGVYYIEYPGRENFRGTLTLDEKTFDSINTKKRSNRPYTSAESMADLFRMRFEGEVGNKENMTRAVNFFTQHFFAEQSIKIR